MTAMTEADFNSWRFRREAVHYNGGREWFGYGHQCVTQPRLLVIDRYYRKDHSTQRSYLIDGKTPYTTLDEALAALAVPPVVNADELTLLQTLADGPIQPEQRSAFMPLVDVGMAAWGRDADDNVTCQITDAGRKALASSGPG